MVILDLFVSGIEWAENAAFIYVSSVQTMV